MLYVRAWQGKFYSYWFVNLLRKFIDNMNIRIAKVEDAEKLLEIYSYYVLNTALTFEYVVPTIEEFRKRIKNTLEVYPYLVAEINDVVVGYAYASRFHERAAYAWNAEMTIYLDKEFRSQGIGTKLYNKLESLLKKQGIVKTISLITYPSDEYSDFKSMQFHEKMGYKLSGKLEYCGYKFGRWYTTMYMDKMIGEPLSKMSNIRIFEEINCL